MAFVWPRVAGSGALQAGSTGPQPAAPIRASFLLRCWSPSCMLSKAPMLGVGRLPPPCFIHAADGRGHKSHRRGKYTCPDPLSAVAQAYRPRVPGGAAGRQPEEVACFCRWRVLGRKSDV